jgi:Type I phosphodiesterase / nucleotide pyrophosphatase
MRRYLSLALTSLAFLVVAGLSGLAVARLMGSLTAFRSPFRAESLPAAQSVGLAQSDRLVIVLIDALRYDTSIDAQLMPTLARLRSQGASAELLARPPSYSEPMWAVLLSGAYPEISGAPPINLEYGELYALPAETLFTVARRAGLRTAVSGYNWFERMIPAAQRDAGFFTPGEDDAADVTVVAAAQPWLASREYGLVLIHIDQVDYAGHHQGGPRDPHWNEAAARADSMLASIMGQLDLQRDTLLVVGDHGQIDRGGHGGQDLDALRTTFVVAGAGVKPVALGTISMSSVAPTMAALLGLPIPSANQGTILPILVTPPSALAALAQQQTHLADAYLASIGRSQPTASITASADPVDEAQSIMESARSARLAAERLPRAAILIAVLIVLAVLLLRARRALTPVVLPAVAAVLVFHFIYVVIEQRTYSLSSVESQEGVLGAVALNALAGYLAGAAILAVQGWRRGDRGLAMARHAQHFTLLTLIMIVLFILPGYWDFGLQVTWALPDFLFAFLAFLGLLQLLLTSALGALLPLLIGGGTHLLEQKGARTVRRSGLRP